MPHFGIYIPQKHLDPSPLCILERIRLSGQTQQIMLLLHQRLFITGRNVFHRRSSKGLQLCLFYGLLGNLSRPSKSNKITVSMHWGKILKWANVNYRPTPVENKSVLTRNGFLKMKCVLVMFTGTEVYGITATGKQYKHWFNWFKILIR